MRKRCGGKVPHAALRMNRKPTREAPRVETGAARSSWIHAEGRMSYFVSSASAIACFDDIPRPALRAASASGVASGPAAALISATNAG